ncbi:MAG: Uma2 family endonuclease [Tildeniella torsiva UHER 1998/13D]|jgi:Uma2 family endonuclease|nr:Uma2 family endonuclease [Tildeniella torsiva UHER 1998/13D]
MTATLATPLSQIELTPGSALRISGVAWESYIALLTELGDNRATRIAYDGGVLEIRMPGQLHEVINRLLASIIQALAEELGTEFNNLGSMRINRSDLAKGIEPDSCFYIQNAQAGQGLETSISPDLPPDLALEIDIASRSDSKLPIYLAIGVSEVWLYRQEMLSILVLRAGEYHVETQSQAFPSVTAGQLDQWVKLRKIGTDLTVIRAVRQFCQSR